MLKRKMDGDDAQGEQVANNLLLVERGQYTCQQCNTTIGEYRVFEKQDESSDIGNAVSNP